jgi:hypothetical protein
MSLSVLEVLVYSSSICRFPFQDNKEGDFMVPSVLVYDRRNIVRACGSETNDPEIMQRIIQDKWKTVKL